MGVNRYWRVGMTACAAGAMAVGIGALSAPVANADGVGVAGLDNEASYLADLVDADISITKSNAIQTVKTGYLLCLIDQLDGSINNIDGPAPAGGWARYMKSARRHLCDYMPSLPEAKADADRKAAMDVVSRGIFSDQYNDVTSKVDDILHNRPVVDDRPDGF